MLYSAAICDPNDFQYSGFTLRQRHMTLLDVQNYNEDEDEELFCQELSDLCKRDRSKISGEEESRGVFCQRPDPRRGKINSSTLSVIAAMGAYLEGVAESK
jgi:chitin synthase